MSSAAATPGDPVRSTSRPCRAGRPDSSYGDAGGDMTQRGEGGPGDPVGSGTSASLPATGDSSPWAPLAQRAFRWLWLGMLFSWIGTWMQTVGAQWLLVDEPNAAVLVSLVQAATTLPLMLLALPGGVLADSFDRRRLLLTVQAYLVVLGVLLTVFTAAGLMPSGSAVGVHAGLRRGRSGSATDLAGDDARTRAADAATSGDRAGCGQRERGPLDRAGTGRAGDRLPGWRPGGLCSVRGLRCRVRGRRVLLARTGR